ncbi:MAG: hypothetical protein AB1346_07390 [Thermodesulfobacteriota bacterium]
MLRCKEATRLISLSMDESLPMFRKVELRLHILICRWCARYERQLLLIRDMLRGLDLATDRPDGSTGETLSEPARERIKASLRNA